MLELEVSAIGAVPPSRIAADLGTPKGALRAVPPVAHSPAGPRDFDFTYDSGDTRSPWNTRAC
jgi:hypothetical protein